METYLENRCGDPWAWMSIWGCESSLEAFLWIDDLTLDDNLGLNLYVVPTTCHVVVISENWGLVRRE